MHDRSRAVTVSRRSIASDNRTLALVAVCLWVAGSKAIGQAKGVIACRNTTGNIRLSEQDKETVKDLRGRLTGWLRARDGPVTACAAVNTRRVVRGCDPRCSRHDGCRNCEQDEAIYSTMDVFNSQR